MKPSHALAYAFAEPIFFMADGYLEQCEANLAEVAVRLEAGGVVLHAHSENEAADAGDDGEDFWNNPSAFVRSLRPYAVKEGVLTVPVNGMLLSGFPYAYGKYATGYEYIEAAFARGCDDPKVKAIAFSIDSPGGMVAGLFEMTDNMATMKKAAGKPVAAFCTFACSAAYATAVMADVGKIIIGKTSTVGSIGVMTYHDDYSGMMEKVGVKRTYVYAGKFKVEGNSTEPLSAGAKNRMQERIDYVYDMFTGLVATNRGMDVKAVRATEALTYYSEGAIKAGLADKEEPLSAAMIAFRESTKPNGAYQMKTYTEEEMTALITKAHAEGKAVGVTEGATAVAAAVTAERGRIAAIVNSDEAKGKTAAALALALAEDAISPATASAVLKSVVVEKAEGGNAFERAMDNTQNPNAGAEAGQGGEVSVAQRILATHNKFAGTDFGPSKK